jgi:hypothetical protein
MNHEWKSKVFRKPENADFIAALAEKLSDLEFTNYNFRNLQAQIMGRLTYFCYIYHEGKREALFENLTDKISDGEYCAIDFSLRTLINFIEKVEDDNRGKDLNLFLPCILQSILSAFTNEEIGSHGREQVLHILYLCLRSISWADGIENELIEECLNETFNQWMAVFLQVIQSDAKKFFDIKRNALKCLTVIFRDFINYSRECINMILRPAWKLMNMHLPIFTEVLGYNKNIAEVLQAEEKESDEEAQGEDHRGFESEEDDEVEEPHGVKGMTLQLIELLTTLV